VGSGFRRRVYLALNPQGRFTLTARLLIVLILLSTIVAILETEPALRVEWFVWFFAIELGFAVIFSVEYAFRIWSAPEGGTSRLRYALSLSSIIDLIVVVAAFLPLVTSNLMVLRLLRVVRIFRLAKIGRFSRAVASLERALRSRASHLLATLAMAAIFLLITSSLIYWAEGAAQPDRFGSVPRAMWWAIVTMTTVGYGDVVPATIAGKIVAGLTTLGGIVFIAIPTGILAATFSDELTREKEAAAAAEAAASFVEKDGADPLVRSESTR